MRKISLLLAFSFGCGAAEITYSVQTLVGSNLVGDGGPPLNAQLSDAQGLAVDRSGNVYIADPDNHRVRRVSAGVIETVAGTGLPGFTGDGGPASEARLNAPYGVAADAAGNVYIADLGNHRVRKVTAAGIISTVAGTGAAGSEGDGALALSAQLHSPRNVAVDAAGNLYISEFEGHRIRRVTADGIIRTIAGTGVAGTGGEGFAAISAELAYPAGMTFDSTGALYVADTGNQKIRRVLNGVVTTLPVPGFALSLPTGISNDGAGGFYIADSGNRRVLRRTPTGVVMQLTANLDSARDVAVDIMGNLLIADGRRVRLLTAAGLSTLAGDGAFGFRGDGGAAVRAVLNGPDGVAVGADGSIYIADGRNHRVRKVSGTGEISTIAGTGASGSSLEGLSPTATPIIAPEGLYADPAGAIWIGERFGARVRRLTAAGTILTIAGTGASGFNGDFRAATGAQLQTPGQVTLDPSGVLYIADSGNHRIRKVSPGGIISTIAGTGVAGFGGDGGQAASALLNQPRGIAFDATGNLYIADTNNHRVRKVTPGGLITTVAGDSELPLRFPRSLAVDLNQNVYICDTENHRIVRLSAEGTLSVIAGTGGAGFSGDGGAALAAQFSSPSAITLDMQGDLLVADLDNNRIRKLTQMAPSDIPAPVTHLSAVFLHAATLTAGPVAPGEILSIAGDGIGPWVSAKGEFSEDGSLPTQLAETQVLFDGRAAPLFDAQQNQIRVQVPYEIAEQASTLVEVYRAGERRAGATLAVTHAAPGIFTVAGGTGPAMVANFDGALNWEDNPANPGSLITFYATGEGQTYPAGISGKRSTTPYGRPAGEVVVRVGGRPAELVFLGEAPGRVGILQIDAIIPTIVDAGAVNLSVTVGSADSQSGVTVFVR